MTVSRGNNDINSNSVVRKCTKSVCSIEVAKKRVPIVKWLPHYTVLKLVQDIIAGITVGLTAIPQGIAYAVVAGLSPEYGLYAGLMGGFVYLVFGSCKDVTVGPTAILSAMVAKYVQSYSADFAVLAAFLAGAIELTMGLLNLGFLVEFISMPVISGFTTAAALQIASAQLKSLFGLSGPSGNYFAESVYYFFRNIRTAKLWDPILGFATIGILFGLQRLGQGCSRNDNNLFKKIRWFASLSRNAVVVILGMIVAFIIKVYKDSEPLALIGDIGAGLPKFEPPPFSTVVGNETLGFTEMVDILGPQSIILPLVAILELVAIAKAFSGGTPIDATQELIALGLCNILGSFLRSMPITGSFTRTALNHASGVQTQAGGIFKGIIILLALSLLTSTFYYIPKASLSGLIITAMFAMIDFSICGRLWINCKRELFVLITTIIICLSLGLEYGIVAGIIIDAAMLLYSTARPPVEINTLQSVKGDFIVIPLCQELSYCSAEHIRRKILRASQETADGASIIIDGTSLKNMDSTVASNLIAIVKDIERNSSQILFLNFNSHIVKTFTSINPKYESKFVKAANVMDLAIPKSV